MLPKNSMGLGAALGLVLPGIVFLFEEILNQDLRIFGKESILYLLSASVNLVLVRYYLRRDADSTARGLLLSTFICTLAFFYFKMKQ
jgi:hypothetical protein